MLVKKLQIIVCLLCVIPLSFGQRPRDYGIDIGILPTEQFNAITDVPGVRVGHTTIIKGDTVNTGVTALLPHGGNIFREKVPAAMFVAVWPLLCQSVSTPDVSLH